VGLVDHDGVPLAVRNYRRIVSGSTIADAVLLEICEPERIVALTARGAEHSPQAFRYAGWPTIAHIYETERILALHPDLVLLNTAGDDPRPIARLRESGVAVFDLGAMRGMATLIPNIREIARILGHPERGESMVHSITAQMRPIESGLRDHPTNGTGGHGPRSLYLSAYGGILFGGGPGTSYHDILVAAGLTDVGLPGWPQYTTEQVLTIAPDVIVTNEGMRARICGSAGLARLSSCAKARGVVEIDPSLFDDPGPTMVDAAWALRAAL
jgi:iron complex transport system substrate-binding protein